MHAFIESYNSFPQLSSPESSSSSHNYNKNSTNADGGGGFSEPEVKLASQNPKKRAGRKTFKETRHPVYRGVRSRDAGKWVCEVREPITQSRVWLGSYPTPEMAARAHDVAVLAMRGPSACLNFADSVWRLPVPESNNVRDIQKAAREAAKAFRHTEVVVAEETKVVMESGCYEDEEEMYDMPEFLNNMAEALMISPPQTMGYTDFDICGDMSLWSF